MSDGHLKNVMDFKWTLNNNVSSLYLKCCFDVHSTSFERYERQMDIETTL